MARIILLTLLLASCGKPNTQDENTTLRYKVSCYHLAQPLILRPHQISRDNGVIKLFTDQGIIYASSDCTIEAFYI